MFRLLFSSFQKILDKSAKSNIIWAHKSNKFYNKSMKPWLQDNIYSTRNEGKSVVASRSIRELSNKISKYMTSNIMKNEFIAQLDNLVDI